MGPEAKDSTRLIEEYDCLIDQFNTTFKDYPREIVGGPQGVFDADLIKSALQRLGHQSSEIFMIGDFHGGRVNQEWHNDHEDTYVSVTQELQNDLIDSTSFTSYDLCTGISELFEQDSSLTGKKITMMSVSCAGGAGAADFPYLPPDSKVVTWSDANNSTSENLKETFSYFHDRLSVTDKPPMVLNQKSIIPTLLITTSINQEEDIKNRPLVFTIHDAPADSVKIVYNTFNKKHVHHEHYERIGRNAGSVVDCSEKANNLLGFYSEEEIYQAAAESDISELSPEMVRILVRNMKLNENCNDVSTEDDQVKGGRHYLMAYAVSEKFPERQKPIANYLKEKNLAYKPYLQEQQTPTFFPPK